MRTTRPDAAGIRTFRRCGPKWTGRPSECAFARAVSSRTEWSKRPNNEEGGPARVPLRVSHPARSLLTQQFNPSNLGPVTDPVAELDDPRIPAGPGREAGPEILKEPLGDVPILEPRLGEPPRMQIPAPRERDEALRVGPEFLGLGLRG